jgi:hypothetical protein
MCRNIKTLFNFEPPATPAEIHDAALQFVRKVSGFNQPASANQAAFDQAVGEVTSTVQELLSTLTTKAPAKDREIEAAKDRGRAAKRFT